MTEFPSLESNVSYPLPKARDQLACMSEHVLHPKTCSQCKPVYFLRVVFSELTGDGAMEGMDASRSKTV